MIQNIHLLLREKGLQYLAQSWFPGDIYYNMCEGHCNVVWILSGRAAGNPNAGQVQNMQQGLQELFLYPQGRIPGCEYNMMIYQVELLTMVVTDSPAYGKELCSFCRNCWILDDKDGILMIYENQPGDFMGLREPIQQLLQRNMYGGSRAYGRGRSSGSRRLPIVNISMVLLNVLIFVVLSFMGNMESGQFVAEHGGMFPLYVIREGEWWRLLTSMFLHFGVLHLANNMVILFFTGDKLEAEVGGWKYLIIYLGSGLCGGLLSLGVMLQQRDYAVSAGASGAIFGVIGALLWIVIRNRGRLETLTTKSMILMIVLSLYFGFTSTGVDNWCHIGGLIGGFFLSVLLYRRKD